VDDRTADPFTSLRSGGDDKGGVRRFHYEPDSG
jgi:hypothetical protein